jgi:hypothetical protein
MQPKNHSKNMATSQLPIHEGVSVAVVGALRGSRKTENWVRWLCYGRREHKEVWGFMPRLSFVR